MLKCNTLNSPFYSYSWKRGWSSPCFDTTLLALLCKSFCYANYQCFAKFTLQKEGGLYRNKVNFSLRLASKARTTKPTTLKWSVRFAMLNFCSCEELYWLIIRVRSIGWLFFPIIWIDPLFTIERNRFWGVLSPQPEVRLFSKTRIMKTAMLSVSWNHIELYHKLLNCSDNQYNSVM